jgi:hypothetical protein
MPKLSDSQLVILNAACKRRDGSVYPVTSKLTGGALAKVLSSLLAKGLVKEVRAKQGEPHWRLDDEERPLTLIATSGAAEALGIGEGKAGKQRASTASTLKRPAKGGKTKKSKPHGTRADSKQAQLIAMLKEKKGATIDEIVRAFGWQPHTVRGAIAGALKKRLGLDVTSAKVDGRGRVYRIAG